MRKKALYIVAVAAAATAPAVTFADEPVVTGQEQQRAAVQRFNLDGLFTAPGLSIQPNVMHGGGGPEADVDGTWVGLGASTSWFEAANWTTNPQVPDGTNAIARFTSLSGGAVPTLTGNATLNKLFYNDPLLTGIVGGQLTLANTAEVNVQQSNSDNTPRGALIFASLGTGGNTIGGVGSLTTTVAGSAGLTKTGPGPLQLDNANTFSGPVNISGGRLTTTVGDSAFGNAANPINISNGATLFFDTADLDTTRTINIGAGGANIAYFDAGRQFISRGDITGSSTLTLNGISFAASGNPVARLTTPKSFSGTLRLQDGSLSVEDSGALLNVAQIVNDGTFVVASGGNRVGNSVPISMRGSTMRTAGAANETVGNVTLDGSTSWFMLDNGSTLAMGNLSRNNAGDVSFRGQTLGTGGTTITIANGNALLKGGIIPFAYANAEEIVSGRPEAEANTLVTYGANGVTPLATASYATDINTSTAGQNVLISDAGATVTGDRFANALVIRATDVYFNDTPVTVGGTGTINLTTGVILNGHAGFNSGGAINSLPGNLLNANVNAGTNELMIMAPSAMTINGVLAGSGGLTKNGGRTVTFHSLSTYTGVTNLGGFIRFVGDVLPGQPGPFGADSSAINIYAGNFSPENPGGGGANGTMDAAFGLAADATGNTTIGRGINVRGPGTVFMRNFATDLNATMTFSGPINVAAGALLDFQGGFAGSEKYVVSGNISGTGDIYLQDRNGPTISSTWQTTLSGDNSGFTGKMFTSGNVLLASAGALGNATVVPVNDTFFHAVGGPRTFSNNIQVIDGFGTAGSNPITFSGNIAGQLGDYTADIRNTSTTTWSGSMSGGGVFKEGPGTLVISGNNAGFGGNIVAGNGSIAGGAIILGSNNAVGEVGGLTAANHGENAVMLQAGLNITSNETFIARGEGIGGLGALRSLGGVTNWGGSVIVQEQAGLTTKGTIGVDSGSLTVQGTVFTSGTNTAGSLATTLGVRKVGAGVLNVGSETFTSGTSTFQGSVVATGSLEVATGTLRMLPNAGGAAAKSVADVASISIAGGPGAPTAKVDLTNNAMVVDYASGGPSPLQDIRSYIVAGYAGGAWSGNGITTSNGNTQNFGLGYAENNGSASGTNFTNFLGDPVDNSAVLVRFTRYGDANIDGTVNLADFNRLAANFGLAAGAVWGQGDFTYDGIVNLSDFNRLAANFGLSAGPDGVVDPEDWAALAGAIPEPSALSLVAIAGLGLLKRRRRTR